MKIIIAKEISVEEATKLFGNEFQNEYEDIKADMYLQAGDHVVTNSGLVLLAIED